MDKFEEKIVSMQAGVEKVCFAHDSYTSNLLFHHLENIHEYNVLRCEKCDYRTLTANSLLAHKNSHKHDRKKLESSMKRKRNADIA